MRKLMMICFCLVIMAQSAFAVQKDSQDTIYVADSQQVMDEVNKENNNIMSSLDAFSVSINESTIMPVYQASLFTFAETGELEISPMEIGNGQVYVAEVRDQTDKFAGIAQFTTTGNCPDIHMMIPTTDQNKSVDFRANSNRVDALMANESFCAKNSDCKMVWVEGLGYVYYVNNGNKTVLIASGLKGTNGDIFTEDNNGIVVVDDSLKTKANLLIEKQAEFESYLATLSPGENPATGNLCPAFIVDNAAYNYNNHEQLILALGVIAIVIIAAFAYKHKIQV